ncbi:claudin 15-like a isoform X2 [Silurus meridionalis]|uniref:claudin 15-like a isoform X2 n=1 Tax=Silurus meridionalis TaxID=175797 RepID=UPI001EEBCA22|nr:claudin 15-like a isoform X2 [Silurus meridionalis]
MSTGMEVTGFLLGIASWLVTGASLANDYWKVSSFSGSIIISSRQYENLWHACAEGSTGIAECRDFESLLALPGFLQACRALMIVALLLGLTSMIVSILGLKCITIGSASDQVKAKRSVAGGILFILAGLCTMTAISWYAARVVEEFKDPFSGGIKFELGAGVYMGWGGACLSILGGGLLCCACKDTSSGRPKGYYPSNQAAKIHKPVSESETARAYV